jgi:hypothetical protein
MHATCPTHLIILHLDTLVMWWEEQMELYNIIIIIQLRTAALGLLCHLG